MSKSRVYLTFALFALTVATIACFSVEERQDVDLNSGAIRLRTLIGPIVFSERLEDTSFTKMMRNKRIGPPEWHQTHSKGMFWRRSSRFGLALSKLKEIAIVCEDADIDANKRQNIGVLILKLVRDEQYEQIESFIEELQHSNQTPSEIGRLLEEGHSGRDGCSDSSASNRPHAI